MEPPKKNFVMNFGAVGKSTFYRVACDCTDPQCDLTLEFEANPNDKALYLHMYKDLRASAHWGYTESWYYFDWLRVLLNKIKMCWRIFTRGYIEVTESFIIRDEEHIMDFSKAVVQGLCFIERIHAQEELDAETETEEKELP